MVCRRLLYLQKITKAIEEAKMSAPNMNARSLNKEECTDPNCDCAKCQLKAARSAASPVKAKSSMLSCCGSKKAKSREEATCNICKCASDGDIRPALSTHGATSTTSATSAMSASSKGSAFSTNCDGCYCGCSADVPCVRPPRVTWYAWFIGFLPLRFQSRGDFAPPAPYTSATNVPCVSKGGAMAKKFGGAVGRNGKVVANAIWIILLNIILFVLRVTIFLIDLSMVLLHGLTHWYW